MDQTFGEQLQSNQAALEEKEEAKVIEKPKVLQDHEPKKLKEAAVAFKKAMEFADHNRAFCNYLSAEPSTGYAGVPTRAHLEGQLHAAEMKIDAFILEAKFNKLKQDYMELRENEAFHQVYEHYRADKKIIELLEEKNQKVQEAIKKDEAEFDEHLAEFEEEYADFYESERSREEHKKAYKEKAEKANKNW